jgi:peptidyl-prolyl isomerase D
VLAEDQATVAGNAVVYLDVHLSDTECAPCVSTGRLVLELDANVPRAAENFRGLCTGEYGLSSLGTPLHYQGTHPPPLLCV